MTASLSPSATLSQTAQNFRKLGLDLPADLTDELARIECVGERALDLGHDTSGLAAAVFDALYRDEAPTGDAVMREALLVQLRSINIAGRLTEEAERRRSAAIESAADSLIAAMAPLVEEADAAFADARERIPHLDLSPDHAAGLPAEHLTPWGRARDSVGRLELVLATWQHVGRPNRWSNDAGRFLPLILADLSLEDLRALGTRGQRNAARQWVVTQLALSPHRLSLASVDEYRDRIERVSEAEVAEAARAAARREQYARTGYTEETKPAAIRIPSAARL